MASATLSGARKEVLVAPSSPIAWHTAGHCFGSAKYAWSVRHFTGPAPLFLYSGDAVDAKGNFVFTKKDVRFTVVFSCCWHFFRDLAPVLWELCGAMGAAGSAVPRGQSSLSICILVLCVVTLALGAAASEHLDCKDQEL